MPGVTPSSGHTNAHNAPGILGMVLPKTIITLLFSVYPAYHHPWRQSNAAPWCFDTHGATVSVVMFIVQATGANVHTHHL